MPGLMDLPVELRLEIYGYVLQQPTAIELEMRVHHKRNGGREIVRTTAHHTHHRRGQVYDKDTRKWVQATIKNASILFTSHAIHDEAEPVLYGSNCFSFKTTTALKDFLAHIGRRTQHIRHVHIGERYNFGHESGYAKSTIRGALKLLTEATGLRSLSFGHEVICHQRGPTTTQLALDCKTLFVLLQKKYRQGARTIDAHEILSVRSDWTECYHCQRKTKAELDKCNTEEEQKARAVIAGYLA